MEESRVSRGAILRTYRGDPVRRVTWDRVFDAASALELPLPPRYSAPEVCGLCGGRLATLERLCLVCGARPGEKVSE